MLESLDYRSADADFQFGTSLSQYSDFSSWSRVTPVLGSTMFLTLTLPSLPSAVRSLNLAPAGPGSVQFNAASGTFSATAAITEIVGASGSYSTGDPLAGGTVAVTGTYTGSDFATMSDIVFGPVTLTITGGGANSLVLTSPFSVLPAIWRLGGQLGAVPARFRPMVQTGSGQLTQSFDGSPALASIAFGMASEGAALHFAISSGNPALIDFQPAFQAQVSGNTRRAFATDGSGGVQVGIVDMLPSTEFHHFVQMNPSGAVGAGPFFGLAFGSDQVQQIALPLGLHPLHAVGNAEGAYFWGLPAGSVPPGLTLDVALVEIRPLQLVASPVLRVSF